MKCTKSKTQYWGYNMTKQELLKYLELRLEAELHHRDYLKLNGDYIGSAKADGMAEICDYMITLVKELKIKGE